MANEIVDEAIDGQCEYLASVVKIKLLNENAKLPKKAHDDDACYDVVATSKEVKHGGKVIEYGLGFSAELPPGTQLDVRARSSVCKTGLILANGIGTGDEGYRGEYKAVFYHVVPELTPYEVGDRVCQIQIVKRLNTSLHLVDDLSDSVRGEGGWGSTGGFGQ